MRASTLQRLSGDPQGRLRSWIGRLREPVFERFYGRTAPRSIPTAALDTEIVRLGYAIRIAEHDGSSAHLGKYSSYSLPELRQRLAAVEWEKARRGGAARDPQTRAQRRFIAAKIPILRREGYPPSQAVAVAYRMAGVPPRRGRRGRASRDDAPASERFIFPTSEGADIFQYRLQAEGYRPRRVGPLLVHARAPDDATRAALSWARTYSSPPPPPSSRRDRRRSRDPSLDLNLARRADEAYKRADELARAKDPCGSRDAYLVASDAYREAGAARWADVMNGYADQQHRRCMDVRFTARRDPQDPPPPPSGIRLRQSAPVLQAGNALARGVRQSDNSWEEVLIDPSIARQARFVDFRRISGVLHAVWRVSDVLFAQPASGSNHPDNFQRDGQRRRRGRRGGR